MRKLLLIAIFCLGTISAFAKGEVVQKISQDSIVCNLVEPEDCNYINHAYRSDSTYLLTDNETFRMGAVWKREKVKIQSGFITEFSFKISKPYFGGKDDGGYTGADGFALVIQTEGDSAIGVPGGCMGYYLIENALVVEFDQYKNSGEDSVAWNDPNGNHVAVQWAKNQGVSGMHNAENSVDIVETDIHPDGTIYYCKVDFDSVGQYFNIYLSENSADYGKPILELHEFDINKLIDLDRGYAYMGFTAATGRATEYHEIVSWRICEKYIVDANECDSAYFKFSDFANTDGIYFNGMAQVVGNKVELTDPSAYALGAVWRDRVIPVVNGFETIFSFSLSKPTKGQYPDASDMGADGIALVIQNSPNGLNALGESGGGLGYSGISNAVAFEIDLFANDQYQLEDKKDPNGNHFAVMAGEKNQKISSTHAENCLISTDIPTIKSNGTPYYVKIKYVSQRQLLIAWVSETPDFSESPAIYADFDLQDHVELLDDVFAYVGLTAATGDATQNHDILSWSFCPGYYSYRISYAENSFNKPYKIAEIGDMISINSPDNAEILNLVITDAAGNRYAKFTEYDNMINLCNYPNGVYYISFDIAGKTYFDKFLICR